MVYKKVIRVREDEYCRLHKEVKELAKEGILLIEYIYQETGED